MNIGQQTMCPAACCRTIRLADQSKLWKSTHSSAWPESVAGQTPDDPAPTRLKSRLARAPREILCGSATGLHHNRHPHMRPIAFDPKPRADHHRFKPAIPAAPIDANSIPRCSHTNNPRPKSAILSVFSVFSVIQPFRFLTRVCSLEAAKQQQMRYNQPYEKRPNRSVYTRYHTSSIHRSAFIISPTTFPEQAMLQTDPNTP